MILDKILSKYKHIYLKEKVNWYYLQNCILEDCKGNGTQCNYLLKKIKEIREEKDLPND